VVGRVLLTACNSLIVDIAADVLSDVDDAHVGQVRCGGGDGVGKVGDGKSLVS